MAEGVGRSRASERMTILAPARLIYETRLDESTVRVRVHAVTKLLSPAIYEMRARPHGARAEKANDQRLEQTLEYHAARIGPPGERASCFKRLAEARHRSPGWTTVRAFERWEQTLRA